MESELKAPDGSVSNPLVLPSVADPSAGDLMAGVILREKLAAAYNCSIASTKLRV
jgi:hypothetical protein